MEDSNNLFCKRKKTIPEWAKVLGYNLILSVLIVYYFCQDCFYSLENILNTSPNILYSFLLCVLLGYGNNYLINRIDEKISWIETPVKLLDYSLEQIEEMVDPARFFRINRQFIISFECITDMVSYTNSRIKLALKCSDDHKEIIVSREKIADFKKWLDK